MPSPKLPADLRHAILVRDDFTCAYCGDSHDNMTVDHLDPRSWGGTDDTTNLVCACRHCNVAVKGGMDLEAFAGMLYRRGLIPSRNKFIARVRAIAARPVNL